RLKRMPRAGKSPAPCSPIPPWSLAQVGARQSRSCCVTATGTTRCLLRTARDATSSTRHLVWPVTSLRPRTVMSSLWTNCVRLLVSLDEACIRQGSNGCYIPVMEVIRSLLLRVAVGHRVENQRKNGARPRREIRWRAMYQAVAEDERGAGRPLGRNEIAL